jgi:DNA-binding transcriptional regulator YiaG
MSTNSSFKAKLARLGPTRAVDQSRSGSSETLVLDRPDGVPDLLSLDAILLLRQQGVPPLAAKRAIETVMHGRRAIVQAEDVADIGGLVEQLRKLGVTCRRRDLAPVDVGDLRARLGLSQEDFALRFNLDVEALRNWEQRRRIPDRAAENYLRVIACAPDLAEQAISAAMPDPQSV